MDDLITFKHELQNIITGNDSKGENYLIKATQTFLRSNHSASSKAENKQLSKTEEERALIQFASDNNLWVEEKTFGSYVTEGAEQKVYFPGNTDFIFKTADAIFYQTWLDYFNNLLLHNVFFANTAYELVGFYKKDEKLLAVVKQKFIVTAELTNLENIKQFLLANGFKHKKNNDYFHPFLGIILEDLHDENVLTNNETLFFIDTVFYLTKEFYK